MDPKDYDNWYKTARGKWIGEREYTMLRQALTPGRENSILDVGCGTGVFTRSFAREQSAPVAGVDPDSKSIEYAKAHAAGHEAYTVGSGENLPFPSKSFDFTVAVTSLCFVENQIKVLQEMTRTAKKKIAVGLLNRNSILWRRKGKDGGEGAYTGAHWHTRKEVIELFQEAGLPRPAITTAIYFPSGSFSARLAESMLPKFLPWGGFMLAVSDIPANHSNPGTAAGKKVEKI